jgi:hypothetical protein
VSTNKRTHATPRYQSTGPFGKGLCSDFSLPHCHHHGPVGNDPYPAEGTPGCPDVTESPKCPKACDAGSNITDFKSDKYVAKIPTPSDSRFQLNCAFAETVLGAASLRAQMCIVCVNYCARLRPRMALIARAFVHFSLCFDVS